MFLVCSEDKRRNRALIVGNRALKAEFEHQTPEIERQQVGARFSLLGARKNSLALDFT